jgi:hypothetical protein
MGLGSIKERMYMCMCMCMCIYVYMYILPRKIVKPPEQNYQ